MYIFLNLPILRTNASNNRTAMHLCLNLLNYQNKYHVRTLQKCVNKGTTRIIIIHEMDSNNYVYFVYNHSCSKLDNFFAICSLVFLLTLIGQIQEEIHCSFILRWTLVLYLGKFEKRCIAVLFQ
jgi:hypothetical protein